MKSRKRDIDLLTPDEVHALVQAASHRAPTGIRNRALIVVLYRAALRLSEALALLPKDLDPATGAITVQHGKGDRRRTVALDPGSLAIVARWLDRRSQLGINGGGRQPIFCTLRGEAIDPRYVRALLARLAKKAGIEKRVHPHGLRHSRAAELAGKHPIHIVRRILGHASLATTQAYIDHLRPADVVEIMAMDTWESGPEVTR